MDRAFDYVARRQYLNYTMGARQPGELRGLACIQNEEVEEIKPRPEHEEQGAGEQGGRRVGEVERRAGPAV